MAEKKLLEGVRILALEQLMVLPYGTAMLGDMGAEVIRVEHPDHIIDRRMGPWPDNSMNEQWWNGRLWTSSFCCGAGLHQRLPLHSRCRTATR